MSLSESQPPQEPEPAWEPPSSDDRLKRYGLVALAALALGLGVTTAVLAGRGPREVTTTRTDVSTTTEKPTTTTEITEVTTTTTTEKTTTETTDTVTETTTVTEAVPPGQEKPKPPKPGKGNKDEE